jgi:hypothetical protein
MASFEPLRALRRKFSTAGKLLGLHDSDGRRSGIPMVLDRSAAEISAPSADDLANLVDWFRDSSSGEVYRSNGASLVAKADSTALKTLTPSNNVLITADGTGQILTFDTAQDLRTSATPTFAGLVGRTDGANVATGKIGERIAFQATAVAVATTLTPQAIVTASFPAGDWEAFGLVVFKVGAGTLTFAACGLGLLSNVLPGDPGSAQDIRTTTNPTDDSKLLAPSRQCNFSQATNVYLMAKAQFGTSCTCDGYIWARRMS